jgi:hypothetical protein
MSFKEVVEAIAPVALSAAGSGTMPGLPAQAGFEAALDRAASPGTVKQATAEMQISPAAAGDGLGERILGHIETFYERSQAWQSFGAKPESTNPPSPEFTGSIGGQPAASAASGGPASGSVFDVSHASVMLERAFAFAIETTLISKASTESTRIFNTFLKGQ